MALSASFNWEIRTTGADDLTQGGGFKSGATGSDYSQQTAAQYSFTNLVVDGADNTKVTSASHNFVAADVGNILAISAGAGFTTGYYEIVSVASNAATLDRSPGAVGITGGTFAVGGALASPGYASGVIVSGNSIYIKNGTYTITSASSQIANGALNFSTGHRPVLVQGYNSSRGDGGSRPTITTNTTGVTMVLSGSGAATGMTVDNVIFDGGSQATSKAMNHSASYNNIRSCKFANFTGVVITPTGGGWRIDRCEFTGCSSNSISMIQSTKVVNCSFHANSGVSLNFANGTQDCSVDFCLFYANTADDIAINNPLILEFNHCSFYGGTSNGFTITNTSSYQPCWIRNSIFEGYTGGSAISTTVSNGVIVIGCAFYNNSTSIDTDIPSAQIEGTITLSGSPFTNAAGGDFSLNNTASAGALCRRTAIGNSFPGGTSTGYADVGAVQVGDTPAAGGGGGASRARVMLGM